MSDPDLKFVSTLETIIADRFANPSADSYTSSLVTAGPKRIAQKLGEEAVELALAAVDGSRHEVVNEAADLVFHLLVLLKANELRFGDVVDALESRHTDRQPAS